MDQAVYQELIEPNKYNYFYELLQLNDSHPMKNVVELLTFGDYKTYEKYKNQLELNHELRQKLIELTLITISNDYDNSTVSRSTIEQKYGINQFDDYIIKLVDNRIIDVKIDESQDCLVFGTALTLRDAYDSSLYQLKLLNEQDIPTRSFNQAVNTINDWYNTKLSPLKNQLSH